MIQNETEMNTYFNIGKFNHPVNVGYVMKSIRDCKPLTLEEWEIYYLEKVRSMEHLSGLAKQMHATIPSYRNISAEDCLNYITDVVFRRTFQGYNKENEALTILRAEITEGIQESSKEWDGEYFIDFFFYGKGEQLIGIQLKPETFYLGKYYRKVDINYKLLKFRKEYNALTFVIKYSKDQYGEIVIVNEEIIEEIKQYRK